MNPITVTLTFERSTKGTHLFKTDDPSAAVTSVYVKKAAMPTPVEVLHIRLTDGGR